MIKNLFPFPTIREGQKEFMDDIQRAVEDGKILVAHAPTGIGKTAAVLAPSLAYALDNGKMVLFLTAKQSQHKIAVDTLRLIESKHNIRFTVVDIISKQSMCPKPISKMSYPSFNQICKTEQKLNLCKYCRDADSEIIGKVTNNILHVEELRDLCVSDNLCPYKIALDVASFADVLICDYNYVFSDIDITGKIRRDLSDVILIVDEAHNLPDRIRKSSSNELSIDDLDRAKSEIKKPDPQLSRQLRKIGDLLVGLTDYDYERNIPNESFIKAVEKVLSDISYESFVKRLMETGTELKKDSVIRVADFLSSWQTPIDCSRIFDPTEPKLLFKILDPSLRSKDVLDNAHATILMSGTLYPPRMYADILGANPTRTLLKSYESPFPEENRLIIIAKNLTTLYKLRGNKMFNKISDAISRIAERVDGNIAVFFPSYKLMKDITRRFPVDIKRRSLIERRDMSKREKVALYDELRVSERKILCGVQAGSFSEGTDYADNMLRSVIIVGLPLSPPTLDVKNICQYYTQKFGREGKLYGYIFPAITKVLQAAGRCIRSETDRGAIILMDYRFNLSPYRNCLPPDYNLKITSEPEVLCENFFERTRWDSNPRSPA